MFTNEEPLDIVSLPINERIGGWISSNGYPSVWDIHLDNFSSIVHGSTITQCVEKVSYNTKDTETKIVVVTKKSSGDYVVIESPLY